MPSSPPNPFTFGPAQRLRQQRQFDHVFEARCSAAAFPLRVYGRPNGLSHCRLGLVVSRRVGHAVRRNRAKRMLREAFRLLQHDLPAGYDLVVIASAHDDRSPADYQRLLRRAAEQVHRQWTNRATSS